MTTAPVIISAPDGRRRRTTSRRRPSNRSNRSVCCRHSASSRRLNPGWLTWLFVSKFKISHRRSPFANGTGRRTTESRMLKTADVTPTPSASVAMAMATGPLAPRRLRTASREIVRELRHDGPILSSSRPWTCPPDSGHAEPHPRADHRPTPDWPFARQSRAHTPPVPIARKPCAQAALKVSMPSPSRAERSGRGASAARNERFWPEKPRQTADALMTDAFDVYIVRLVGGARESLLAALDCLVR